jgi:hypothetical protein
MVLSVTSWSLRCLLELVALRRRSEREKEIEICCCATNCVCCSVRSLVRS